MDRDNSFSLIFFLENQDFIASVLGSAGPPGGDNPPRSARRGAHPGGLCPPRFPPPVVLGFIKSLLLYKKILAKFRSVPRTFISAQKQHHDSSAENSASPGLVSFKSCKLESKTRGIALGKVDTSETYQLP